MPGTRQAAARPHALWFLYADGHARVCYGTRTVQYTYVARLKFPAAATMETWVTDQHGDPVFMVIAEPSVSLAGELRRLLPQLRQVTRRPWPTMPRRSGSRRRTSAASESDGSAMTMNTGSPS